MNLPKKGDCFGFLDGNHLKIIAAISMVIDHVGYLFFPRLSFLRILGRISFPIFAFFIAEGWHYTKSRGKYLFSVSLLGLVCQIPYSLATGDDLLCVPVGFACSLLLLFVLSAQKKILSSQKPLWIRISGLILLLLPYGFFFLLTELLNFDCGFIGMILPVLAALPLGEEERRMPISSKIRGLQLVLFSLGLLLLAFWPGGLSASIQLFGLFSLPFLILYSGKRGKRPMKAFFYLFYPAHFLILTLLSLFLM